MSEFTGDCGCECLPSSGWCEKHKRYVRIVRTDGMTSKEMEYQDELNETPLGEQIDSQGEIEE